jgi:cytosolic carboxypeptidase protein 6
MRNSFHRLFLHILAGGLLNFSSCQQKSAVWQGQAPIQVVPTETVPIQLQVKDHFEVGRGIKVSNSFEGARMNGVALTRDTLLTVLISPENAPINPSPWYSFSLVAAEETSITVKLTYSPGSFHRYYPKLSRDGRQWENLDSAAYTLIFSEDNTSRPMAAMLKLRVNSDTLWVAAQESIGTAPILKWISHMEEKPFVTRKIIGQSHEGRNLELLEIGDPASKKLLMIMALQHPPEIPGYMAMQAFVETVAGESELAKRFRETYTTLVVPMVNPDGVAHGHWRHNRGGVDINRDWQNVHQPEIRAVQTYMQQTEQENGSKFYVAIDFHSTWEDIYYTVDHRVQGNMPGIIPEMIVAAGNDFHGYEPNVRPSPGTGSSVTSNSYFFNVHGAEALTYEVGDNTPRDFIHAKAVASATRLMEKMLDRR